MRGTLRWARADLRARRGQALITVAVVAGVVAALLLATMLLQGAVNPWQQLFAQTRGADVLIYFQGGTNTTELRSVPGVQAVAQPYQAASATLEQGAVMRHLVPAHAGARHGQERAAVRIEHLHARPARQLAFERRLHGGRCPQLGIPLDAPRSLNGLPAHSGDDEGKACEHSPSRQRRQAQRAPAGQSGSQRIDVIVKALALHQQMDQAERRDPHHGAHPRRLGARKGEHGGDGQSPQRRQTRARP